MEQIHISEAELAVMKVLWQAAEPLNSIEIASGVQDRGWKKTTIATFLTRLVEKGALTSEKRGKLYYYSPCITEKAYKKAQTKNLIQTLYNGSARDFALAFFEEQRLSDEDIRELRAIFEEKEE